MPTRYALERALYDAERLEEAAYEAYPADRYAEWVEAVEAYRALVRGAKAEQRISAVRGTALERDVARVALRARIGLLRLYRFDCRLHDAVTHPGAASDLVVVWASAPWREGLPGVSRLYESIAGDPTADSCAAALHAVIEDAAMWVDPSELRDSLLAIPLELAVSQRQDFDGAAVDFYTRVVERWPELTVAGRARACRARAHAGAGRFEEAIADIDGVIDRPAGAANGRELLLLKGQILAFGLHRESEGRALLDSVIASDSDAARKSTARLCVAILDGSTARARQHLRAVATDSKTPPEIAAGAMLIEATYLEEEGAMDDAVALVWRLCRLYPNTDPALVAPLRVVRQLVEQGRREDARRALDHATKFYLEQIGRDSAQLEPRDLPKDLLVECYLLLDVPQEAARILESRSGAWAADNAMVARFKSALVHMHILGDPKNAASILQKSLALFPRSRYLRATQRELNRIVPARGSDAVSKSPGGSG